MKLSQLTLNGSFSLEDKKLLKDESQHLQGGYHTPRKNNLARFMHQQSASTLARTNSAGPKTFIKRVSKMKNQQQISRKSSIKQISSQQDKSQISPLMKNCFKKSNRPLMSINSIKRINFQSSNRKKDQQFQYQGIKSQYQNVQRQLQRNRQITDNKEIFRYIQTQRKHYYKSENGIVNDSKNFHNGNHNDLNDDNNDNYRCSKINDNNRTILPTNYTSVKLFMSTKFKKGIKQKIPVNILAVPDSIHQKQTSSELSISQVSHNHLLQTVLMSKRKTL